MGMIWTSKTRASRPQGPARVNWSNSITQGLLDAYLFGSSPVTPSLISPACGVLSPSSNGVVGSAAGIAHYTKAAEYGGWGVTYTNARTLPSSNFTILVVYEGSLVTQSGFDAMLYGNEASGGLTGRQGKLQFANSSYAQSTITPSATGIHAVSGDYGGTAYNFAVDGKEAGSFTSGMYNTGGVPVRSGYTPGYAGLNLKLYAVFCWGRRLPLAEQVEATARPWQLFAPQRTPVFYSIAGVSPGPSTANRIMLLRRPGLSRIWR